MPAAIEGARPRVLRALVRRRLLIPSPACSLGAAVLRLDRGARRHYTPWCYESGRFPTLRLVVKAMRYIGVTLDPDTLFGIQVQRIREYKWQLLDPFQAVALYNGVRERSGRRLLRRAVIFAGRAAVGYFVA